MRNLPHRFAIVLSVLLVQAAAAAGPVPTLPFEQVRNGMTGIGRTVFEGEVISEFQVEVIGLLPGIGPDQDLILARCTGGPLAETGILAGMSGSPVYIDGRLVGAVAFAWGFSKEPIAGITPIGQMLAIPNGGGEPGKGGAAGNFQEFGRWTRVLRDSDILHRFFSEQTAAWNRGDGLRPFRLPLSISGLGTGGFEAIAAGLSQGGFVPMQAGGGGSRTDQAEGKGRHPLRPGSAIGVKLVRGDVEISATGTVTWVQGDQVLAFGHPLFGLGGVDFPMTAARVEALLPSLQVSSRMARPTEEIGALRLDRPSGIYGVLGARPRMIPIRLQYQDANDRKTYSFDVADDPSLAPILLYYSLNGILASRDRPGGNATLRIAEGSVIKLQGRDDISLHNLFAGPASQFFTAGTTAYILHLLMNNEWETPRIEGVNLILEHDPEIRTGRITGLSLDRYAVHPGETVRASVTVVPWRGPERTLVRELAIPPNTRPGRLQVEAGGVLEMIQEEGAGRQVFPHRLDQFIYLINNLRKNDQVFIVAARNEEVLDLEGNFLPNLPPSAAAILSASDGRPGKVGDLRRNLAESGIPVGFEVHGLARATLVVTP